jgi:hypothetical protein
VDMTLDPNIIRYIDLRNEQKNEMNEIASVSNISLGQNQNTIGKGVQQNTINQNSYGLAPMFYGLMHHFERILQYNVDLQQMIWSFEDSIEESLVIGDEGSFLISCPTLLIPSRRTGFSRWHLPLLRIARSARLTTLNLLSWRNRLLK